MRCSSPEAVTPEEIVAYVDGDAPPRVVEHIRSCSSCAAEARRYARAQARLRQALHRFDCPTPQTLGEYNLGLVSAEDRVRIAAHVLECSACAEELRTLRAFLADEPPSTVGSGAAERLRRIVAALVTPRPGLAPVGLRGAVGAVGRTYEAEGISISISVTPGTRRGRYALVGLVLFGTGADYSSTREVVLAGPAAPSQPAQATPDQAIPARATPAQATPVDDFGNFAFDDLTPGIYQLELRLSDRSIVVEALRIGD